MSKASRPILSSLIVLLCSGPLATAHARQGAHPCASVDDDAARLECYDEAFGRPDSPAPAAATASATPVTAPVTTAAAAPPAPAAKGRDEFGLTEAQIRARDPEKAQEAMPSSITGKVTQVGARPTGELVVTLDNEQVWVQIDTGSPVRLEVGDHVTIRKASLGSFLMITPSRVAVRVRRYR